MPLLELSERVLILTCLQRVGTRRRAAQELGIGYRTLCGRLRSWGFGPHEKPDGPFPNETSRLREYLGANLPQ